jgi:hypothetical protein
MEFRGEESCQLCQREAEQMAQTTSLCSNVATIISIHILSLLNTMGTNLIIGIRYLLQVLQSHESGCVGPLGLRIRW